MSEKEKEEKRQSFYYANGMGVKQCRQICKFYFGLFFFRADLDKENHCVYIYLYTWKRDKESGKVIKLEEEIDVKYFDDYWCQETKQWVIKLISPEDTIDVQQ